MQSRLQISKPTLYLCAPIFVLQVIHGFAVTRSGGEPTVLDAWYPIALFWAVGWWFINDSRTNGINWNNEFLDMGMFLYIAWIVILPYYLFKSRDWKAISTILLISGVYLGAFITGALLHLISTLFL
jgi:hypothetical protein